MTRHHFRNIHYIDFEGGEHYYTIKQFPTALEKKVKLLNYFRNYMKEHLLKAGANIEVREGDELSRIPALKTWFRTSRAVVMHLSNGTLQVALLWFRQYWDIAKLISALFQINFFKDHTKIILCPLMGAVTYIDEEKRHRTFRFDLLVKYGCTADLEARLSYALEKINTMLMKPQAGAQQPASSAATGTVAMSLGNQ